MTKLLFIEGSPRDEQSKSIQVAETYRAALKATNPALEVDVFPLWKTALPAFGADYQSTCLKAWLNQAGVIAIDRVTFPPTLLTPDPQGALEQAKREAMDLANMHARV